MSDRTVERLTEWAKWFHYHKGMVPRDHLTKRIDFLEKAVDGAFECMALVLLDLKEELAKKPGASLYIPRELLHNGDLKRLG